MSRSTYGTVEVDINGKSYELKPTLKAYEQIESRMGGLRQAIESVSSMSIEVLASIVAIGAGRGMKDLQKVKEDIFAEGALNVLPKVTEYLMLLLNPSGKDDIEGESSGE